MLQQLRHEQVPPIFSLYDELIEKGYYFLFILLFQKSLLLINKKIASSFTENTILIFKILKLSLFAQ